MQADPPTDRRVAGVEWRRERERWRSVRLACQCEVTRGLMAVLGLSMVRVFRVAGRLFQLPRAYWGQSDGVFSVIFTFTFTFTFTF